MLGAGATDSGIRLVSGADLTPAELDSMNLLLQAAFHPWPAFPLRVAATEHLRWKTATARGRATNVILTSVEGHLASCAIHMDCLFRVQGHDWRVLAGSDVAVHPDFQNRGLYGQRRAFKARVLDANFDMSLNVSLNPWVLGVRRRQNVGITIANGPRVLVRVQDASRLTQERANTEGYARALCEVVLTTLGGAWSRLTAPPRPYRIGWQVRQTDRFDERVDLLFEQAAQQFEFIQVRDRRFLNWRYADLRGGDYTILVAEDGSELLGYVVFKRLHGGAQILDLLALSGRTDVAVSLLDRALLELRDAHSVYAWLPPRHPYAALLASRWFADTHRATGVSFRMLARDPAAVAFLGRPTARMHFMLGDTDIA